MELGAGIGRFTAPLAASAASVVALDFMQNLIDENRAANGHLSNVEFRWGDWAMAGFGMHRVLTLGPRAAAPRVALRRNQLWHPVLALPGAATSWSWSCRQGARMSFSRTGF